MKRTLMKWSIAIIAFLAVTSTVVILYFQHEINHILGGNTEVVDFTQFQPIAGNIAITNVSVFTTAEDSLRSNQTVLIKGDKIAAIGKGISIPKQYQIIDGTGKFLIPGLIDSHVHLKKSKNDLLLYLANGITHIGEMTGMKEHFKWRDEIKKGLLGPGIYIASPKMNSRAGIEPTVRSWMEGRHQNFPSIAKARAGVKNYKALGYDAIKISSILQPEIYYAIVDEAKKQGIPAIGHLPISTTLNDLYKSGQSQVAHVSEITKALERSFGETKSVYYTNTEEYLDYVRNEAAAIAKKLKEMEMVVASTIWLHETIASQDLDVASFLKTIELEYMNPGWVEGSAVGKGWLPGNNSYDYADKNDPESMRLSELVWTTKVKAVYIIIQALNKAGVTMIAGTDANGADGVIPGFSLHDELKSLSGTGLDNAEILRQVTKNAGEWMAQKTGQIKVGYEADLVILDKNPLQHISHTKSINVVITDGKLLDRTELDKMLKAIKDVNNRSRKVNIDEFIN